VPSVTDGRALDKSHRSRSEGTFTVPSPGVARAYRRARLALDLCPRDRGAQ
jgi:hypothetical protein